MQKEAILAGGCFWGLEELFCDLKGVIDTEAGYTGGEEVRGTSARLSENISERSERNIPLSGQRQYGGGENPTYESHQGHAEALLIIYDDAVISYKQILDFFFQIHNPTTLNQQGNDRGTSYRSAIFYKNGIEKQVAEEMIEIVNDSERWDSLVVTTLEPYTQFWPAEEYHQDYLQKNVGGYTCHAIYFDSYLTNNDAKR